MRALPPHTQSVLGDPRSFEVRLVSAQVARDADSLEGTLEEVVFADPGAAIHPSRVSFVRDRVVLGETTLRLGPARGRAADGNDLLLDTASAVPPRRIMGPVTAAWVAGSERVLPDGGLLVTLPDHSSLEMARSGRGTGGGTP